MSEKKLTVKQQRFVEEYMVDFNATQAAIRAGYSAKTAAVISAENLRKPNIQKVITQKKEELAERTQVTVDMVVKGLMREAAAEGEGTTQSARVAAWAHLGKYLGMFTEKVEHSVKEVPTVRVVLNGD